MKLSATHAFNCIVLMVKFGWTNCEDIPPALACCCNIIVYLNYCDMNKTILKNHIYTIQQFKLSYTITLKDQCYIETYYQDTLKK